MATQPAKSFTIDMTPSWAGVLPIYLMALHDGSLEAQRGAREELTRMAGLADAYVAIQKAEQGK